MTIVVYSSHTGSTKKYAESFSNTVGYPCFSLNDDYNPDEEIIYFGWVKGPRLVGLDRIDPKKLIAVVTVSIENDRNFLSKVKEVNKIHVPVYHLRGWIDRKKVGLCAKILFVFICAFYKLRGLDDYTGPMFDAMMNGGSFYDEAGLEPLYQFVKSR